MIIGTCRHGSAISFNIKFFSFFCRCISFIFHPTATFYQDTRKLAFNFPTKSICHTPLSCVHPNIRSTCTDASLAAAVTHSLYIAQTHGAAAYYYYIIAFISLLYWKSL